MSSASGRLAYLLILLGDGRSFFGHGRDLSGQGGGGFSGQGGGGFSGQVGGGVSGLGGRQWLRPLGESPLDGRDLPGGRRPQRSRWNKPTL